MTPDITGVTPDNTGTLLSITEMPIPTSTHKNSLQPGSQNGNSPEDGGNIIYDALPGYGGYTTDKYGESGNTNNEHGNTHPYDD